MREISRSMALDLAGRIISQVSRERPADLSLRQAARSEQGLPPTAAAYCSRAVFAFFRWRGWLDLTRPLRPQIERALELDEEFSRAPTQFSDADLVARALPAWLSEEMEITGALARVMQTEPRVWLRARPGRGSALAEKLGDCLIGPLPDSLEYGGTIDLFRTAEFHTGEFELQDISSQAVGWVCSPAPGQTWWDACAGEGGKLLHLSDLMGNRGLIWASDRSDWRLKVLKRRAARAKAFNYRLVQWDGSERLPTKTKFDGLLVDAPCSGVGTWQRNPHARWTTTLADVRELAEVQKKLLKNAARAVKGLVPPSAGSTSGVTGRLVYSVCTLTRTETQAVAEAFERDAPDFEPVLITNPLSKRSEPNRHLTIPLEDSAGNGMFIAVWRPKT